MRTHQVAGVDHLEPARPQPLVDSGDSQRFRAHRCTAGAGTDIGRCADQADRGAHFGSPAQEPDRVSHRVVGLLSGVGRSTRQPLRSSMVFDLWPKVGTEIADYREVGRWWPDARNRVEQDWQVSRRRCIRSCWISATSCARVNWRAVALTLVMLAGAGSVAWFAGSADPRYHTASAAAPAIPRSCFHVGVAVPGGRHDRRDRRADALVARPKARSPRRAASCGVPRPSSWSPQCWVSWRSGASVRCACELRRGAGVAGRDSQAGVFFRRACRASKAFAQCLRLEGV